MSRASRPGGGGVDLVLSSGFLAFAKHAGFLKAVQEVDLDVRGVMGTSSGAYAGSLYCAGYSPDDVARELCSVPPYRLLRHNLCFWEGFFLLDGVVDRLRDILPPTFEGLDRPLAVGVVDAEGRHRLIDSGPLPEAVAASGAVPGIFTPVDVPGQDSNPFLDGGVVDRTGLTLWRRRAPQNDRKTDDHRPALVHLVERSSSYSGHEDAREADGRRDFLVVTRKSGRNLFSLGDYKRDMIETYEHMLPSVHEVKERLNGNMDE